MTRLGLLAVAFILVMFAINNIMVIFMDFKSGKPALMAMGVLLMFLTTALFIQAMRLVYYAERGEDL